MADTPELEPDSAPREHAAGEGSVQDRLRLAERRLAERTRELDLLQSLGRRAAEARTPGDLFSSVVSLLHRSESLDLALVGYEWDGAPEMIRFVSRPIDRAYLAAVEQRARRFLGWPAGAASGADRELSDYDEARGPRRDFAEQDLVLLPLLRAGQPVACLLLAPAETIGERRLRLVYSASNQLSLHLERLLTVREAEADRFRAIVDAMPQGVVLTDPRLRVLQANRAAEGMLASAGFADARTLETPLAKLGLRSLIEPIMDGRAPFAEGEARPDRERVWSVTVAPMSADRDRPGDLVFVWTDVTERRRLQIQLAQSEKMSGLGQMISGVAHELNNPLASILGYAQLVRQSGTDERTTRYLEVLGREAERCRRIVQNLLSFARRHEPEQKPLSLNQIVTNVHALLEYQLRVDGIRLDRDLATDLPAMEGDAHQLEQVLVNLLTNGAQAIRQTGKPGAIVVRTRAEKDGALLLEVRDDGPGISEELRSKVFDPFFTTKAPGQGTGLGLSLVYGIVTAHGGTIDVVGHDGPGTTFRLRFPGTAGARVDDAPAVADPDPPAADAGAILVVDDDESVARLIAETLEADGHRTRIARDGRQALDLLEREPFDLIISDVKMPEMNGAELWDALRSARPRLARSMLLTTGDTLGTESEALGERSGLELLGKPFDLDELRRRVRERLTGGKADPGAGR